MTNPLAALQADLEWASRAGGEQAGQAAVRAGVAHNDNGGHALLHVEAVHAQYAGPMSASVTASQPAAISPDGPKLPGAERTAEIMADKAAEVGQKAILGKHR